MEQTRLYCSRCGGPLSEVTFWCENCQQDLDGHPTSAEVDEANAIVGRIQVAFNGVVLGNGMTIHEADLEGVFESELSRRIAREKDVERNWSDVPDWKMQRTVFCIICV